jgi:hypothetical protein
MMLDDFLDQLIVTQVLKLFWLKFLVYRIMSCRLLQKWHILTSPNLGRPDLYDCQTREMGEMPFPSLDVNSTGFA